MYEKYFGLSRDPFSIAPDPRYLFMSERHREALAHLLYGLNAGGGFVLLSGDIGTWKTTVCRCFLEQIPAHCNVAYIFNPKLSVEELLTSICDEFHVSVLPNPDMTAGSVTTKSLTDRLNAFLLTAHAAGQNNVLIIDEAQNLSSDVLEQLRLLTNLETNERKLLQIILIGQPELRGMLARPELEQLAQRVIARFHLEALSPAETTDYIAHRLAIAGLTAPLPFNKKALARAYSLSRGVPRRINLLCGRALLGAYAGGKTQVDRMMLDKAAREVFGTENTDASTAQQRAQKAATPASRVWMPVLLASAVGLVVGAAVMGATGSQMFDKTLATAVADLRNGATATAIIPTAPQPVPPAVTTADSMVPVVTVVPVVPPSFSGPAASRLASRADFQVALAASTTTQNQAWRALGPLWGIELNSQDACGFAQTQGHFCYVKQPMSLLLIRQLDRPGFLTLTGKSGQSVYALLTGLTTETATLTLGETTLTVALAVVADTWNGSFSTLWRQPVGLNGSPTGPSTDASKLWLSEQLLLLAQNQGTTNVLQTNSDRPSVREPAGRDRVNAFQIAQGLPADGRAGPLTLMQLNRALGLPEPRLTPLKN